MKKSKLNKNKSRTHFNKGQTSEYSFKMHTKDIPFNIHDNVYCVVKHTLFAANEMKSLIFLDKCIF